MLIQMTYMHTSQTSNADKEEDEIVNDFAKLYREDSF